MTCTDRPQLDGNLYRDYPDEFLERVWDGCTDRDCLPKCDTNNGHCERLKLAFDEWLQRVPAHRSHKGCAE